MTKVTITDGVYHVYDIMWNNGEHIIFSADFDKKIQQVGYDFLYFGNTNPFPSNFVEASIMSKISDYI